MVIFMPYYRQHGQLSHSHTRTHPSSTVNEDNNVRTTINNCHIVSNIVCRLTFSLFLLLIALFLLYISIYIATHENEGSPIIAIIFLTVAIISFIRTCQKLRQYYVIMNTRRQLVQRLRERQQAYDNPELVRNLNHDLPSYKELFPSRTNISNTESDSSPPSYDDYVKTLSSLPHSHVLPLSNISSRTQTNSTRCIWITDRARRPLCIRGTVTYV